MVRMCLLADLRISFMDVDPSSLDLGVNIHMIR